MHTSNDRRKTQRFPLEFSILVVRAGAERVAISAKTANISSTGVLFNTDSELKVGEPLEYIVALGRDADASVKLRCFGMIVRCGMPNGNANSTHFEVAATLERYEFLPKVALIDANPRSRRIGGFAGSQVSAIC